MTSASAWGAPFAPFRGDAIEGAWTDYMSAQVSSPPACEGDIAGLGW
jgi:hypothetical protein